MLRFSIANVLAASLKPFLETSSKHPFTVRVSKPKVLFSKKNNDSDFIEMKGNDVFKIAVNTMGELAKETLKNNNIAIEQIDWLIPHQANSRIINAIAKKISLPAENVITTIREHGNKNKTSQLCRVYCECS